MMSIAHAHSRRRSRLSFVRQFAIAGVTAFGTFAAATPSAHAQASRDERLLLGDLFARMQRANPKIAAANLLARAAETRVSGARRPPDPQLQFGFMNYTIPNFSPMSAIGMPQLQIMQMVPLGGKLGLAGRVAGSQASATNERAADMTWELRSQSAMAFYDLYATDRRLDVARETLRILQDIESTAETVYRVGEGRQTDVLRAQVEIAKMAEDTVRMHAMRETMVAKINALLDRDASVVVGSPVLPHFPDSIPSRASIDSIALGERPMLRAGLDDVRAAESAERLARKEIWPDLQIGVQYAQRGGEMGTERMASLMFGATIPVFARDKQLERRDEARLMQRMALADLAAMRADTRGKIGEAYANLTRARNLAQLYRTTVLPQAEATVASALATYRVGRVDFMTLLDDRMTVNKYKQELFALDADQGKAWAELEMLAGRELFDPNGIAANSAFDRGDK